MVQKKSGSTATKARTKSGTSRYGQKLSPVDQANQAAFDREQEVRELFDEIIETYSPGGAFGRGYEAMLEREKTKALAKGTQSLISSGLYGSTMTAGLGTAFEENVGMPTRARLEDLRTERYTGALGQKASFIEGIQDITPSFETIGNLTAQANAAPQESLSDWLYGTFQGGGTPTTKSASNTRSYSQTLSEMQSQKKKQQADYEAKYANVPDPVYDYENAMMFGVPNTEEARDARKKAGYYLGSDGKYHKL